MPVARPREMDILPFDHPGWDDRGTLTVADVSTVEAVEFVSRWHYAGCGAGNSINAGLYCGMHLVGVAAFGVPISQDAAASVFGVAHAGHVWDLSRFVLVDEAPRNTESWFLVRALRHLKSARPSAWAVTSFADSTEGHIGTIYQATNAMYGGMTGVATQYVDQDGRLRSDRSNGRRITRRVADQRGWTPIRREAKHRYVFLLPDNRTHRRHLTRLLRWTGQPYPKREGDHGC